MDISYPMSIDPGDNLLLYLFNNKLESIKRYSENKRVKTLNRQAVHRILVSLFLVVTLRYQLLQLAIH